MQQQVALLIKTSAIF